MFKKIFLFFTLFLFSLGVSAENVEDVFVDIDKNYPYLKELQTLYDKGIILPDNESKFQANSLLNRDEFVAISMHTMCRECVMPFTDSELIFSYAESKPFFDINKQSKYFYCVADASKNNFVAGYNSSHVCEDGTTKSGEKPFCENNKITLDEAIAVLLRNSKIFTQEDNQRVISQIESGEITQSISNDVSPKNSDGNVYTFYGYLQKALEYQLTDYDAAGNEKKYFLLQKDAAGNINPKKYITKEEFLQLAFIIAKTNSCTIQKQGASVGATLASKIEVYDKMCQEGQNCDQIIPENGGEFDFKNQIQTNCFAGVKEVNWIFLNLEDHSSFTKTGLYLDNIVFPKYGNWQVRSLVFDNCGGFSESQSQIYYKNSADQTQNPIGVVIGANPISGIGPLKVDFESLVSGCQNCKYEWNFVDGSFSSEKNPTHIFSKPGVYEVMLKVTDSSGNTSIAKIVIKVEEKSSLGGQIVVYDPECSITQANCKKSDLGRTDGKYDFSGEIVTTCQAGIAEYNWIFTNTSTQQTQTQNGKYINDFVFPSFGVWKIELIAKDKCGGTISVSNIISYNDPNIPSISQIGIEAIGKPLFGKGPLDVDFESIVRDCNDCEISWNFGDGQTSSEKNPKHIFEKPGTYEVIVTLTDKNGKTYHSKVVVVVTGDENTPEQIVNTDTDNDGIFDSVDACPTLAGVAQNNGCPILNQSCNPTGINTCGDGMQCGIGGYCEIAPKVNSNCISPTSGSSVFGKAQCNSCPCDFALEFLANIRQCDEIFPAIVSPDATEIFSRGEVYLVPKK